MRHKRRVKTRPGRNHRKQCHCLPTCKKILSLKQRCQHYRDLANNSLVGQIRASESVPSDLDAEHDATAPEISDNSDSIADSSSPDPDISDDNNDRSSSSSSHVEPSVVQDEEFGPWDWVED
ncbi:hypothetical protein M404DRAFT_635220 [Pisolithus tinctorius Marx 270]|uniref:Uncharacterized protein n=1 Tax=Pisolithus tinctorius Marx 270 TaxID=870435 RepID=A0A0C3K0I0_PISTI|nr:hypothetical protein M404DRAFT_635220 [Pisolithus tinctorius Marx 270]